MQCIAIVFVLVVCFFVAPVIVVASVEQSLLAEHDELLAIDNTYISSYISCGEQSIPPPRLPPKTH